MKHRGYSTLSTWRWILSWAGSFFNSVFTTNVHGRSKHLLNLNTTLITFKQCFKRKLKQTLLHLTKRNEQNVVLPFPLLYVYSRLPWNCSARGTLLLNSCSPLLAMSQLTFSGKKKLFFNDPLVLFRNKYSIPWNKQQTLVKKAMFRGQLVAKIFFCEEFAWNLLSKSVSCLLKQEVCLENCCLCVLFINFLFWCIHCWQWSFCQKRKQQQPTHLWWEKDCQTEANSLVFIHCS